MSIEDLQKLAFETATGLKAKPGVAGVFVMVVHEDNLVGTAQIAPAIAVDIMFASGIEALLQIRKQGIANAIPLPGPKTPIS